MSQVLGRCYRKAIEISSGIFNPCMEYSVGFNLSDEIETVYISFVSLFIRDQIYCFKNEHFGKLLDPGEHGMRGN